MFIINKLVSIVSMIKYHTDNSVDLPDSAYSARPVITLDPYHQFVPSGSTDLVEELQALLISLGVKNT